MKHNIIISLGVLAMLGLGATGCTESKHTFAEAWSSDANIHWHACTDEGCDATTAITAHTPGEWIVDSEPTCDTDGSKHKECIVCHYVTSTQVIDALGHNYSAVSYVWSNDNSTCTATKSCGRNSTHNIVETATAVASVTTAPSCTSTGVKTFTATFTNSSFTTQTKNQTLDKLAHTPGEWIVDQAATCNVTGTKHKECSVCHAVVETGTVALDESAHIYGAATYAWTDDLSSCTATKVCANNSEHKLTETVTTSSAVTQAATCSVEGVRTFTATFTNAAFAAQNKTQQIEKIAHTPSEWIVDQAASCSATGSKHKECTVCHTLLESDTIAIDENAHGKNTINYVWSDDMSTATAFYLCTNDYSHRVEETVTSTSEIFREPTCSVEGLIEYKATFTKLASYELRATRSMGYTEHDFEDGVCTACGQKIITIGSTGYTSFAEAINDVPVGFESCTWIKLHGDMTGDGVKIGSEDGTAPKFILFDFQGHTYTLNDNTVGSVGTETNGFQLLKGDSITFKNGTIKNSSTKGAKIMFQNYGTLILDNFTVDLRMSADGYGTYCVSNNCGVLSVTNGSNLYASDGGVAFDVWFGMSKDGLYDDGVCVSVSQTAGIISGQIEYGCATHGYETIANWRVRTNITIYGGTFQNFSIIDSGHAEDEERRSIKIYGGTFDGEVPSCYVDSTSYQVIENNGLYTVVAIPQGEEE